MNTICGHCFQVMRSGHNPGMCLESTQDLLASNKKALSALKSRIVSAKPGAERNALAEEIKARESVVRAAAIAKKIGARSSR